MTTLVKPMLAGRIEDKHWDRLRFPLLASDKLDGIRASVQNGVVLSRNLKPIRNEFIQETYGRKEYEGFDGEFICGDPTDKQVFNKTSSAVMSQHGRPDVKYHVFDLLRSESYQMRLAMLENRTRKLKSVELVLQKRVESVYDIQTLEECALEAGYEGLMLRAIDGRYKEGRSSVLEGHLMKLKRFVDSEAELLEVVEQYHNANEAVREVTGRLKRSSHQENMIGKDTAGSLRVRDCKTGVVFNIGSGLDDAIRSVIWAAKEQYVGRIVKYKHFPIGSKDRPRFPIFLGFRDKADM